MKYERKGAMNRTCFLHRDIQRRNERERRHLGSSRKRQLSFNAAVST